MAMKKTGRKELGIHTIVEFYGCDKSIIQDSALVEQAFRKASEISGATIVKTTFHHFNPHGISGVVVIAESHFSVHTWPEYGYAAIDFFSCSKDVNVDRAIEYLEEVLKPKHVSRLDLKRGILL